MDIECAHCGSKQLMQIPGTWTPMPMSEEGVVQGPAVPVVMLGCPACGFIQMFSPQAVKPQAFPDRPAEEGSIDESHAEGIDETPV
jgi:hypothetical protein